MHKTEKMMKKGFSLIEMLVVIGILGILITVLVTVLGNTENARSVQCKANLKNLCSAVSSEVTRHTGEYKYYPLAGSVEQMDIKSVNNDYREVYTEHPGWISWNSRGKYKGSVGSHISNAGWFISAYNQDLETREYCITNGSLWRYMGGSRSSYVCPSHVRKMPSNMRPNWSYVMNGYFEYDRSEGADSVASFPGRTQEGVGSKAHRLLMFAELQWEEFLPDVKPHPSASSGFENDCTLQYGSDEGSEIIGFNHKSGNDVIAHIAFADGHVDQIVMQARKPMNAGQLRELTKFLCEGREYSISNNRVEEAR